MRLCLISTDYLPNPGGIAAHVAGLSRALAALGHEAIVLTVSRHRGKGDDRREQGVRVVRVPRLGDRLQGARTWLLGRALERLHAESPLDIVHFHLHGTDSRAARRFGKTPAVFTNHSSAFIEAVERGLGPALWREVSHARRFIAPSQELLDLLVRIGCPRGRAVFIPNAVDADLFRPDTPPWPPLPGGPLVLCPRRLEAKNGVRDLIEATPRLLAECPPARIIIAGDGSEAASLRRRCEELGVAGEVCFLGNVARERMPGLMVACDVVVLPSLKEATSIAGLEAMACGKPLVGTTVGGIPQIVAEGETGLLVPPASPGALAEAIAGLLRDRPRREEMGVRARRRVEAEFTWPAIAAQTVAVYERARAEGASQASHR